MNDWVSEIVNDGHPVDAQQDDTFGGDKHAIVEVMGHRRIAGRISSKTQGSVVLLRVDVPALPAEPPVEQAGVDYRRLRRLQGRWIKDATPERPAYTQIFGASAIFALRVCSAEEALADEIDRRQDRPDARFVADENQPEMAPDEADDDEVSDPFGTGDEL